jgi:hypothetical protein
MNVARHGAAARNALAAAIMGLTLGPAPAAADGAPELILPLVTAAAVVSAARSAPQQVAIMQPGGRPVLSLLPEQLRVPDGYEYDAEDYIAPRRTKSPLDSDRIVSLDLLGRPRRGWRAALAYDEETRGPLTSTGDIVRFVAEFRF